MRLVGIVMWAALTAAALVLAEVTLRRRTKHPVPGERPPSPFGPRGDSPPRPPPAPGPRRRLAAVIYTYHCPCHEIRDPRGRLTHRWICTVHRPPAWTSRDDAMLRELLDGHP